MANGNENIALDFHTVTQGVHKVYEDPTKGSYYVAVDNGDVIGSLMTTTNGVIGGVVL